MTAREAAALFDVNPRTIRSWNAIKREDWIDEQATLREAIRAYHDDEGHTWPQTAEHFNMSQGAVRQRCYRARKEREAEAADKAAEAGRVDGDPDAAGDTDAPDEN